MRPRLTCKCGRSALLKGSGIPFKRVDRIDEVRPFEVLLVIGSNWPNQIATMFSYCVNYFLRSV